jgi:bacteriorhodopsin
MAAVAPRIILSSFFIGQKVLTMQEPDEIAQTLAWFFLFGSSVSALLTPPYWIGIIPGIATWAYSNMIRDKENRNLYRYIDWSLTTPLMLLAILVAVNAPMGLTAAIIACDLLMISTGYLGCVSKDKMKKLVYFVVGILAFIPILWVLLTQKSNMSVIYLTLVTWSLYPIIWYLEEFDYLTEKNITVAYSIMDVIAKVGLVKLIQL